MLSVKNKRVAQWTTRSIIQFVVSLIMPPQLQPEPQQDVR